MKYINFFLTADFGKLNIKRLQTEHMHRYHKTFQLYRFKIQMNNSQVVSDIFLGGIVFSANELNF